MSESTPPDSSSTTPDADESPQEPSEKTSSKLTSATKVDDLPEEFELTPELVEEEAIRGDFMLRWAAVLLAVLLGCTHIAQSETLVHVKAGQHLAANGFLPDGTDPFSYTTTDRVWRNQSWLFDLILAGVHGIGGAVGLSVFKAMIAGVIIWCVVTTSRPRTPTWWNAIVAVVGTIALIPHLTATPEIITLLGIAVLLRLFHRWRFQSPASLNWKLAVLFLLWSNADPRMYLGLLLLLILAAGEMLRRRPRSDAPTLPSSALWPTVGVVCLVTLLNPFGWHSWLSAWEVHGVFDPAARTYFAQSSRLENLTSLPLWSTPFWEQLTVPFVCALVIAGLALSAIYLNFGKWIAGDIFAVLVFGGLAACALREVGPAIVVMSVVASLYCQDWYRESFSTEYTVNRSEILFSKGGRVVTVLCFVAVAWLGISGRLYDRYQTTIGFGFENNLEISLTGLENDLTDSYDNKPFNFTTTQGDTLIWADQRVFIDNRLALFAGETESLDDLSRTDVIELHSRTRNALRFTGDAEQNAENRSIWKATFDRFDITHALPRIAGKNPDYLTYNHLIINQEFQLTVLSPSVAVFYRNDLESDDYKQYLADHSINFIEQAFGEDVVLEEDQVRGLFPRPDEGYVSYFTSNREQVPPSLVLAEHYLQHIEQATQGGYQIDFRTQLAFCYLAIRNANLALTENPDSARAFRLLGRVYFYLAIIEQQFSQNNQVVYDPTLRRMQAHLAFHQSLIGDPDDIETTEYLLRLAELRQQPEAMLKRGRRFLELLQNPEREISNRQEAIENTTQMVEKLEEQMSPVFEQVNEQRAGELTPEQAVQLAGGLHAQGFSFTALEILNDYSAEIGVQSETELLKGMVYVETGRAEDAYETLLQLEPIFAQYGLIDGYRYATFAALGHADYSTATELNEQQAKIQQSLGAAQHLLRTMPMSVDPEIYHLTRVERWTRWKDQVQEQAIRNVWEQAVFLLEQGNNSEAAEVFNRALEMAPESNYRPMILGYLSCLTDEPVTPAAADEGMPPIPAK